MRLAADIPAVEGLVVVYVKIRINAVSADDMIVVALERHINGFWLFFLCAVGNIKLEQLVSVSCPLVDVDVSVFIGYKVVYAVFSFYKALIGTVPVKHHNVIVIGNVKVSLAVHSETPYVQTLEEMLRSLGEVHRIYFRAVFVNGFQQVLCFFLCSVHIDIISVPVGSEYR